MFFNWDSEKEDYLNYNKKLREASMVAVIDSTVSDTGYGLEFQKSLLKGDGGIYLKIKDSYGKDWYTQGFLAGKDVLSWALPKIKAYIEELNNKKEV